MGGRGCTRNRRDALFNLFLEWIATWWSNLSNPHPDGPIQVQHGLAAYAMKQATICHLMVKSFVSQWYPTLLKREIPVQWPQQYIPIDTNATVWPFQQF
jgi:hypothetical protein